jgi:hypothetical protein
MPGSVAPRAWRNQQQLSSRLARFQVGVRDVGVGQRIGLANSHFERSVFDPIKQSGAACEEGSVVGNMVAETCVADQDAVRQARDLDGGQGRRVPGRTR